MHYLTSAIQDVSSLITSQKAKNPNNDIDVLQAPYLYWNGKILRDFYETNINEMGELPPFPEFDESEYDQEDQ